MKKIVLIIMLALLSIFASNFSNAASLTGDQMAREILSDREKAPMTTSSGASKSEVQAIVKGEIQTLDGKINAAVNAANDAKKSADSIGKNVGDLANAVTQNASATKSLAEKIQDMSIVILKRALRSDIITMVGFGLVILAIIILGFFLGRKKNQTATSEELSSTQAAIIRTINAAKTEIKNDVPVETIKLSRKLDPNPFTFEVLGKRVVYTSPAEGIKEGYYLTLQVLETPDGLDHPETFERQAETKRGLVLNYVRGMAKKFLEGKLKGKKEEKLIEHLQKTGEITIS